MDEFMDRESLQRVTNAASEPAQPDRPINLRLKELRIRRPATEQMLIGAVLGLLLCLFVPDNWASPCPSFLFGVAGAFLGWLTPLRAPALSVLLLLLVLGLCVLPGELFKLRYGHYPIKNVYAYKNRVSKGMTQTQVLTIVGQPEAVRTQPQGQTWIYHTDSLDIAGPLIIDFDAEGRVKSCRVLN